MNYTVRSKKDREITKAVEETITYAHVAAHLQDPAGEGTPGEAIKKMPKETREKLKKAKAKHFQEYPRKYPNKDYG